MNAVYIARLTGNWMSREDVRTALEWLKWEEWLHADSRVFIKPNLTWPKHIPGVTTTPQAIEAAVAALAGRTRRITIGESDGGYHSFRAEEAFQGHGVYDIAKKYNVRVVNLSREAVREISDTVGGRMVKVVLPVLLLEETDVFITLPVPKVHVMTGVSLGIKNQWGCNPSTMRLMEHPQFDAKIVAINRRLNPKAIVDGTFFLDGVGPLSGEAVRKNLLMAGAPVGAVDAACCEVMGIDPDTIRYLRLAKSGGLTPPSGTDVPSNRPIAPFRDRVFSTHRAFMDWVSLVGFRSPFFTWLFWGSPLAGVFHNVLYSVRRCAWVGRLLYGKAGPPPEQELDAGGSCGKPA
jgi:uncharacterized protein (DUF362 family)